MMKIFTVEKFICCLKLEFCAYLFGFVGLTIMTLLHVAAISLGIFTLLNFTNAREIMAEHGIDFGGLINAILNFLLSSRAGEKEFKERRFLEFLLSKNHFSFDCRELTRSSSFDFNDTVTCDAYCRHKKKNS